MEYHLSKKVNTSFDKTIENILTIISSEGFGLVTEINMTDTFKEKLDVNFRNYRILGICKPAFAYKAVSIENKIGVMLPCNIIVQEHEDGSIEVSAINPLVTMASVKNNELGDLANDVVESLKRIITKI